MYTDISANSCHFHSQVVEYILYQLIDGYNKKDKLVQKVLDNYDFYVLPVVNPDGKPTPHFNLLISSMPHGFLSIYLYFYTHTPTRTKPS